MGFASLFIKIKGLSKLKYSKGKQVLPEELIREIQNYIQGQYIYIPAKPEAKKKWGETSGNRAIIQNRNAEIHSKYHNGVSLDQLAIEFCLSTDSIRKIIYKKS